MTVGHWCAVCGDFTPLNELRQGAGGEWFCIECRRCAVCCETVRAGEGTWRTDIKPEDDFHPPLHTACRAGWEEA